MDVKRINWHCRSRVLFVKSVSIVRWRHEYHHHFCQKLDIASAVSYTHLDVYKRQVHAVPWAGMGLIGFEVSDYACNMHVIHQEKYLSWKEQIKAELKNLQLSNTSSTGSKLFLPVIKFFVSWRKIHIFVSFPVDAMAQPRFAREWCVHIFSIKFINDGGQWKPQLCLSLIHIFAMSVSIHCPAWSAAPSM